MAPATLIEKVLTFADLHKGGIKGIALESLIIRETRAANNHIQLSNLVERGSLQSSKLRTQVGPPTTHELPNQLGTMMPTSMAKNTLVGGCRDGFWFFVSSMGDSLLPMRLGPFYKACLVGRMVSTTSGTSMCTSTCGCTTRRLLLCFPLGDPICFALVSTLGVSFNVMIFFHV